MPPTREDYEKIRPGLYDDVQELNADAPTNRPISGKTLRKVFVNWMTLAGMDQNVADAIEARDDHNVSNISYHSTADTKGKLQYPKAVRLFLLEYPLPSWMQEYSTQVKHEAPKRISPDDEEKIVQMLKSGASNQELIKKGICSAEKAAAIAKKYGIDRSSRKGTGTRGSKKKTVSKDLWKIGKK